MRVLLATLLCLTMPRVAIAQSASRSWAEMTTGSELESYLRALQVVGHASAYPVSLRGWSAAERDSLVPRGLEHPWITRFRAPVRGTSLRFSVIRPELRLIENTAAPFGSNDGAVWAGRGLTSALHGGIELRAGPLTVVLDPVFFRAENASFALEPVDAGAPGSTKYNDPVTPGNIDLPQRFGDGAYQRFDPGQSTIRLDLFGLAMGATAANEIWGPAISSPIVLGDNAAGFERVFFGTSRPANIGIGRLHGRLFLGRLGQSAWSPIDTTGGKRLASGIVVVYEPRGLPGLELGVTRFFHRFWPSGGLSASDLFIPFEGFLKQGLKGKDNPTDAGGTPDNQLASAFARLRLPRSGIEVYGEYGREDHSANVRDLIGEPDHASAYTLGFMRAWPGAQPDKLTTARVEVTNGRVSKLVGGRSELLFYEHAVIDQGHTQNGQLLGSPAVRDGGGFALAIDRYTPAGRTTLLFTRLGRAGETQGGLGRGATTALVLDVLRFHAGLDLTARVGAILDTGVQSAGDRAQLHASAGARIPVGF